MRRRSVLVGLAVLVLVQASAIGLYLVVKRSRAVEPPFAAESLQPRPAPALSFERMDGSRATLDSMRGKVVMVHFWATWCEPCRDELPGLLALAGELAKDQPFELLAVSVDDEWDAIGRFFSGRVPRVAVRPDGSDVHRRFGASTLPDTYIVDASGRLVQRISGSRNWQLRAARAYLTKTLSTR